MKHPRSQFRPALNVSSARFIVPPPFATGRRRLGNNRRGDGLRYERRAQAWLIDQYFGRYLQGPWIEFTDSRGTRICQVDGILFDLYRGIITVVEIKLAHTLDAMFQLVHLYGPVLGAMFPPNLWKLQYLELVRWYDPATHFPHPHHLCRSIEDIRQGHIGVHIQRL